MLPQHVNRQVCIVGRVLSSNDRATLLEVSDHQQVQVISRGGGLSLPQQSIVEVLGVVNPDNSVTEISRLAFSDNFNLDVYEEFLKMTQRAELQSIFGRS